MSDRPFLHYNDLVLVSDVDDRSGTRRTYENHPGDELAYKLLHNSRILLKITYLLSIKAMSAATSKRIMQSMYLFEWLEKTEPKFAAILFITFFLYPFRGLISEAKICGLQIRWFGSITVFFKNADLFDQCQKMRGPDFYWVSYKSMCVSISATCREDTLWSCLWIDREEHPANIYAGGCPIGVGHDGERGA